MICRTMFSTRLNTLPYVCSKPMYKCAVDRFISDNIWFSKGSDASSRQYSTPFANRLVLNRFITE
jgi:hypothetical protein